MNKYAIGAIALATAATLTSAMPALAQTNTSGTTVPTGMHRPGSAGGVGRGQAGMMRPSILGTVSAVSGNTITVLGHGGFGRGAATTVTTTFTVDATNAKVVKNNATSSVSNIVAGDTVVVQGTINGTAVIASSIMDQTTSVNSHPGFFGGIGQFFMHLFGF